MRKIVVAAVAAVALIVAAVALAPGLGAQVRGGRVQVPDPRMLLEGPGGEIGVTVRELRSEEISGAKLPQAGGVFVRDVREGSPASRAGLKAGDIVVEFDGERVRGVRHFTRFVRETPPGRAVKATIVRDGSRHTLDVTPEQGRSVWEQGLRAIPRDFDFDIDIRPPLPLRPSTGLRAGRRGLLGVGLTPLSDQLATYFGVNDGVLVSGVEANAPGAQAGLKAGDVITAINGRMVNEPSDVREEIRRAAPGTSLDIRIVRDKKEMNLKVTLPERPARREGGLLPV
jgi:serine protease Do